jgi:hypothetical protein
MLQLLSRAPARRIVDKADPVFEFIERHTSHQRDLRLLPENPELERSKCEERPGARLLGFRNATSGLGYKASSGPRARVKSPRKSSARGASTLHPAMVSEPTKARYPRPLGGEMMEMLFRMTNAVFAPKTLPPI